jgi:putative cardiolipin synthase
MVSEIKTVTYTQKPKGQSPLVTYLSQTDKPLGEHAAFYPLELPLDALAARLFLIDHASTSLDVQYYIYDDDNIGKVFSGHLLMAAQRGVRVRMLLDDLSTSGKDEALQQLAMHPNVELRLFNPNKLRTSFRNLALLMNVNSLGKRMHNKSLIADGMSAIVGGRNIGDVYFAATYETLFLDYDILGVGSVVPQISKAFDIYWNSEQSVLASEVLGMKEKGEYVQIEQALTKTLASGLKIFSESNYGKRMASTPFSQKVKRRKLILTVSDKVHLFYDDPAKVATDENNNSGHISQKISDDLIAVTSDVTIISPYFIPSDRMMERLKSLRERSIEVTIVTNSLASTDVSPVYAGYQPYIKPLLQMGVNLYELKPNGLEGVKKAKAFKKVPNLSLHTKMILIDHKKLAVGSANIDPRSDKLNTELFMVIESKKLSSKQYKSVEKVLNLHYFYKLSLNKERVIWSTIEEGKKVIYESRPSVGFFKALGTDIMSILPIKGYL